MQSGLIAAAASLQTPVAAESPVQTLQALATALAASGAYTAVGVVDVVGARRLTLFLAYVAHASAGAGGYPSVLVLGSAEAAEPGATDESWYPLSVWDGTVTAGALTAGSLPSGTDFEEAPSWGQVAQRPLEIVMPAATANSEKQKLCTSLDVTALRWVQVLVAERGVVASPGALGVLYSLGA